MNAPLPHDFHQFLVPSAAERLLHRRRAAEAWRWMRNYAAACFAVAAVILLFTAASTAVWWNEEREARLAAEERVRKLERRAALHQAEADREQCDKFTDKRTGLRYRWCRLRIAGDS